MNVNTFIEQLCFTLLDNMSFLQTWTLQGCVCNHVFFFFFAENIEICHFFYVEKNINGACWKQRKAVCFESSELSLHFKVINMCLFWKIYWKIKRYESYEILKWCETFIEYKNRISRDILLIFFSSFLIKYFNLWIILNLCFSSDEIRCTFLPHMSTKMFRAYS